MTPGQARSARELLAEALTHFELARGYLDGGPLDQRTVDAISMRLSAGVEVLSRLGEADRGRLFGDVWPVMWGMRNRIAHGYLLVNDEVILLTVQDDLPPLVARMRAELAD